MGCIKNNRQVVIGIAGASASGKSLILKSMLSYFNKKKVTYLDLDGYHFHTRKEREKLNEYPDEIKSNNFDKIIFDIKNLIAGKFIYMPIYNHKNGVFSLPIRLRPKQILFIEGLHSTMINKIADQKILDFSIFLYPDENLRRSWKIKRDIDKRGYSYSEATKQINNRKPFVIKYIFPQINIADMLMPIYRTKSGSIKYRVLLSPIFYKKYFMNKSSKECLLKYFKIQEVIFEDNQYIEIFLKNTDIIVNFVKSKISCLELINSKYNTLYISHQYSYVEITKILFVLILIIISERW